MKTDGLSEKRVIEEAFCEDFANLVGGGLELVVLLVVICAGELQV